MQLPKSFTTVTPFSRLLALSLFILLPIGAFFLGIAYEKSLTPLNQLPPAQLSLTPLSLPACSKELKQCSNGSYVGRTGPNCEFSACPARVIMPPADWKTYTDNNYFSLRYPPGWTIKKDYNFPGDTMIYNNQSISLYKGNGGSTILFPTEYVDILSIGPSVKDALQTVNDYTNAWKQNNTVIQNEQAEILGNTLILYDNQGEGSFGRNIAYSHGSILALFNTSIKHITGDTSENRIIESFRFLK